MAAETGREGEEPVIIKKYANRRLYNTRTSRYITLEDLAQLTRADVEFKVLDAKSGDDITHSVLTQIIMEEESAGQPLLPVSFLRQLIALYGDSMQATLPQFLEASMDAFRRNQQQVREAIEGAMTAGPFGGIARANLELMQAAREAFTPSRASAHRGGGQASSDDVDQLRQELAELRAQIDRITKD